MALVIDQIKSEEKEERKLGYYTFWPISLKGRVCLQRKKLSHEIVTFEIAKRNLL